MLNFLSRLFEPSISSGGNAQQKRLIEHRVNEIEAHLDDFYKFPNARLQSNLYNLIDESGPIYLGSMMALTNDASLLPRIEAVLTIIDPERAPKEFVKQWTPDGITHLYLPLDDHPDENISKYFDQATEFLRYHQERGIPVLVHCMAGMSRSATLLAHYLMKKYNMNALTALDFIKKRRPIVRPNTGFIRQLVEQE
jgi:dual specificity phosphatase 12